jgi:chromosome segregation ATPase
MEWVERILTIVATSGIVTVLGKIYMDRLMTKHKMTLETDDARDARKRREKAETDTILTATIARLDQQIKELKDAQAAVREDCERKIGIQHEELNKLKDQHTQSLIRNQRLATENSHLREQNDELRSQVEKLERRVSELEFELSERRMGRGENPDS